MKKNVGVILAAGRGVRAYPSTKRIPKPMLEIGGTPIIEINLIILRDELDVGEVYIVIGPLGQPIKDHLGDGLKFNMGINYIEQDKPRGIGHALSLVEDYINRPFFCILGDEVYLDSNHKEMLPWIEKDFNVICGFKVTEDIKSIKGNYTADIEGDKIRSLIEKPKEVKNNYLGLGTYVFNPIVFEYIKKIPPSSLRGEVEITDVINNIAQDKSNVFAFFLKGEYTNINTVEDLNLANYMWRNNKFDSYKKSLIIPAYNEADSIANVIRDFKHEQIDEILVVDNNSTDNTAEVARESGAKVIVEKKQGYGNALKCGMDNAIGDILILTEADGSFRSKDLLKILEFLKEADMVLGTRTTKQMIEQGANMDWFLRWGNVLLGKFVEVLWWGSEPRFTDVGCTYRGIWKGAYNKIKDNLNASGPEFSPEMMIEVIKAKMRSIEIPVSYYSRHGGESQHSGNRINNIKTGLRMVNLIIRKRLAS